MGTEKTPGELVECIISL